MDIEDVPLMPSSTDEAAGRATAVVVPKSGSRRSAAAAPVAAAPTVAGDCCGGSGEGCGCASAEAAAESAVPLSSSVDPSTLKVFLHTFGCGHNVSDGEYMAGQLAQAGYRVSEDFGDADCYVINSCTVKNPSEDHFVTMMTRAKATGKPVVVAGCVPQGDPNNAQWSDVSIVGVRNIDQIDYVVSEALSGNTVRLLKNDGTSSVPSLALPKVRRNRLIEIIPINVGCLNFCTYCKTKHARGDLKSWPIAEIVARVKTVIAEGVVEIRMTSEDTGAYGIDLGTNIVELLRAVLPVLEGTRVMLRLGMSNPPYLLRHVKDIGQILQHPNVFSFLHIPVQSGSNAILGVMAREYTVEEFLQCVDTLTASVPDVTIATDIICAFPGEGAQEWRETVALCERVKFPVLNISRFYPRRDTPAAAMKQVPTNVAKNRTTELTTLFNSYSTNDALVGTEHDLWVTEVAHDKHHLVGHTKNFTQVLVDPAEASLGQYVRVKITAATKYSATGVVVTVAPTAPAPAAAAAATGASPVAAPAAVQSTSPADSVAPLQRVATALGYASAALFVTWACLSLRRAATKR